MYLRSSLSTPVQTASKAQPGAPIYRRSYVYAHKKYRPRRRAMWDEQSLCLAPLLPPSHQARTTQRPTTERLINAIPHVLRIQIPTRGPSPSRWIPRHLLAEAKGV